MKKIVLLFICMLCFCNPAFSSTTTAGGQTLIGTSVFLGNVGIGTTSPLSALSVAGNLALGAYGGGASTAAAPSNGLIVSGNVAIGTSIPAGLFTLRQTADQNFLFTGASDLATGITLKSLSDASSLRPFEIVGTQIYLSGGSVYAPNLSTSSGATTGTVCWTSGSSPGGLLNVDTTTTCLLSLEELKDKHGSILNALAIVNKLDPFWFTWKETTPEWSGDKQEQPGLGAHQVESIEPRLAAYTPEGKLKGVRYQELTAVLVAAIKEQQQEINNLGEQLHVPARKCNVFCQTREFFEGL